MGPSHHQGQARVKRQAAHQAAHHTGREAKNQDFFSGYAHAFGDGAGRAV